MRFDADGPYNFSDCISGKIVTSRALKLWFRDHEVGGNRGVYVVVSGLKKPRPWYVGLATKQTFFAECTTPDKLKKINRALQMIGRGQSAFLFLTLANGKRRPTASQSTAIDALETEMIRWAFARNKLLVNDRKKLPAIASYVPGVLRSGRGKPSADARHLRAMLGLGG